MPLLLDPADPARVDPKTGVTITYVRIDAVTLIDELRTPPRGVIVIGLYPDATQAATKERVVKREIVLTPAQAQTLATLIEDRIYTALSTPTGIFPNATVVP